MLKLGLIVTCIGMGIVFIVLAFLILVINSIHKIVDRWESRGRTKTPGHIKVPAPVAAESGKEDSLEMIAVLAAALLSLETTEERFIPLKSGLESSVPAWFQPGYEETMSLKVFSY